VIDCGNGCNAFETEGCSELDDASTSRPAPDNMRDDAETPDRGSAESTCLDGGSATAQHLL
jgi:hypothetical protein